MGRTRLCPAIFDFKERCSGVSNPWFSASLQRFVALGDRFVPSLKPSLSDYV